MKEARMALVVSVFPARSETFIALKARGLVAAGWDVRIVRQRFDARLFAEFRRPERERFAAERAATWPHSARWLAAAAGSGRGPALLVRRPASTANYLGRGGSLRELYLDAELVALEPRLVHFEFGALAEGRIALGEGSWCAATVVSFRGYDLNFAGLEDPAHYRRVEASHGDPRLGRGPVAPGASNAAAAPDKPHALDPAPRSTLEFYPTFRVCTWSARASPGSAPDSQRGPIGLAERLLVFARRPSACCGSKVSSFEYRIVGAGEFHTATAYARYQLGLALTVTLLGAGVPATDPRRARMGRCPASPRGLRGVRECRYRSASHAVPVVCTDADGLPENVADGITGLVVSRRDAGATAEALARLARDPGLRRDMGDAGRQRVLSHFQLNDQIAAFSALYERVSRYRWRMTARVDLVWLGADAEPPAGPR